ncbi:flagellar protein essential for flagellar pocket biogenesis [Diplonema papillatum]|nr:flagellar protein essential for flagellar pocket biogenesis [Diplonema papillatum]
MAFTLLVCGDLFSEKINLELPFPHRPSLQELQNHVQNVFTSEMHAMPKPPGAGAPEKFVVSRIQIYDDVLLRWADLTSPQQLHQYDQLYCFQPRSPWQTDVRKDLPPPRPPTRPVAFSSTGSPQHYSMPPPGLAMGPPIAAVPPMSATPPIGGVPDYSFNTGIQQPVSHGYLPQPTGIAAQAQERPNVPLEDRIRVSFQEIDDMNKGWVDSAELERAFRNRGIDFSANTVGELFVKADQPREGRVDLNKWHHFAMVYPNTVDAVYYRGRDIREEQVLRDTIAQTQAEVDAGRNKEQELRAAADAQAQHNQRMMAILQDHEHKLRTATDRRNLLEAQERALIEQEVKLERQKDALRVSMNKFKETASAFDRDAAQTGSPRRSRAPVQDNLLD